MPYKCVHCNSLFEDGSKEILEGCSGCKSKFFFYIRPEKLEALRKLNQEPTIDLSEDEKNKIEDDVREIAGLENVDTPVYLDFESVRVIQHGKYVLDLGKLFSKKEPKVYQLEDGKYILDLSLKGEEIN